MTSSVAPPWVAMFQALADQADRDTRKTTTCGELDDALYDGIPATRVIYCPTPDCPACNLHPEETE